MKLKLRNILRVCTAFVCMLAVMGSVVIVQAEDSEALAQKTKELQGELDSIKQEMVSISDEISSIEMQTEIMSGEILRTEEALRVAQEDEDRQYEAMKDRIKYLYESGDYSFLDILLSAEDMGDLLNKADFVQTISDYDRNMLEELVAVRSEIDDKNETLNVQKEALADLQEELVARQSELQAKAESTATDLEAFKEQLAQARAQESAAMASQLGFVTTADGTTIATSAVEAAESEVTVFAAILECEAYQDYNSLLAVATVIMNRMADPRFPNTISEIVYAENQFEPVSTGRIDKVLACGPTALSYEVARDALSGVRLAAVADCYFFLYAGSTDRGGVIVGDNVFFQSW